MSKENYLKLVDEIRHHDRLYFVEHKPEISDYQYDLLYKKLQKMEEEHPDWTLATSPTKRVGNALTGGFKQISHSAAMLSLANTYSEEEIKDFIERVHKLLEKKDVTFCCELKMDGVAVSVRYEKGLYVRALTRGDGKKGDDITANMKTIKSLPLELSSSHIPDVLEIRGEVYMTHAVFQKQNQQKEAAGEDLWANPRNAAAGSLKLLDPRETGDRRLSAVFYGLAETDHPAISTQYELHQFLKNLGLPAFKQEHKACCKRADEILHFAHTIEKKRDQLPFDIDGIVIKVNELKLHPLLGKTSKHPRWAVAYKFAPEQAITKICDITVQVGRTGVLTPVAELEPVSLAGSTIARATLHNQEEVERKDIRIGDFVTIEKGGDVIPKVVLVDKTRRSPSSCPWKMPTHCPCCGTPVIHQEGEVAVRCPNTEGCLEQQIGRLAYFASKDALDIDHLGIKVVEQLVRKGLVFSLKDIYTLTHQDLEKLDSFKEKSIQNLLTSIQASKTPSLAKFILALGIRYIGEESAERLAQEAGSIDKLFHMSEEEFLAIDGIGEKMAQALVLYFKDQDHIKEIEGLLKAGVTPQAPKKQKRTDHPFSGKTFVLTGTLYNYTRSQATDLIKERGGKVTGSVSQNTDYVLAGDEAGSKLDKAKKLHITVLSEQDFQKMIPL